MYADPTDRETRVSPDSRTCLPSHFPNFEVRPKVIDFSLNNQKDDCKIFGSSSSFTIKVAVCGSLEQ